MKTILRNLSNAAALVVLGAALYYAIPIADQLLRGAPQVKKAPLVAAPEAADGAPPTTGGNWVLVRCLYELERYRTIQAKATETGVINGRLVESAGNYCQSGRGESRKFLLELQGRVGDSQARLLEVSDGRFLWTDMAWGLADDVQRRDVWRVDLREVRKRLGQDPVEGVDPGQAHADAIDPRLWAGLGGLPTLIESLHVNFEFSAPRQMRLRDEKVYALIGYWKPERLAALLGEDAPSGAAPDPPERIAHHVLVVIGQRDAFPYRVEYRSQSDPLSADGLEEDARFVESKRPLLKLDLLEPQFNAQIAKEEEKFEYAPPQSHDWVDRTSDRLSALRNRRALSLAARPRAVTSGESQR